MCDKNCNPKKLLVYTLDCLLLHLRSNHRSSSLFTFYSGQLHTLMFLRTLLLAAAAVITAAALATVSSPTEELYSCLRNVFTHDEGIALPGEPFYRTWAKRYNLNIPVTPAAVTFPESSQQVAAVVKCAAEHKFPVQAKSGGHGYANHCLGGTDGAVVVDLKHLQQFSMNHTNWQATIGAGTLLGDVTKQLHNAGGRAMSHGTCLQVGSGGHFTIGGLGPTSRQFGASLDHVVEAEVVLANSSIIQASDSENQDVFWAIKGAASGFGIVTEFKVRTEPEPTTAVQYTYTLKFGTWKERAEVFKRWQAHVSAPGLTRKLASTLTVFEYSVAITGTFFGTQEEYDALEMDSQFPGTIGNSIVIQGWLGLVAHWAESLGMDWSDRIPTYFYAKSNAWTPENLMSSETVDKLFEFVTYAPKGTPTWFLLFDLQGGYTSDIPAEATSYAHRDVLIWLQSYTVNPLRPISRTQIEFLDQVNTLVTDNERPYAAYPGYVDPFLEEGAEAYWGANLPRLRRIKADIDPGNVFQNPQSPTPAED
ncbi:unnamed protein product [Penicillium olsonii]|uniref:FAD-binding PCMH-type domain-containing protein n=1 Tax=Penicillium olsonii TaxID=99116 RepID=A0A9W4MVE2_PENOL|nr:unnamed protein product [Penicillium olsonii]CAG8166682.1 unnamed protein product [Penicillium olsonii]